jgi:hypothetical protein
MLRPASTGIRRLANAVIAAIFNVIIFGTGAAIYLFAVDLIMSTASIPAWLQVTLVWLSGIVGWLLLRPYRRITQLGGRDSAAQIASPGAWHRNFFRDLRTAATVGAVEGAVERRRGPIQEHPETTRPETRSEDATEVRIVRTEDRSIPEERTTPATRRRRSPQWTEPDVFEGSPSYSVYRPGSGSTTTTTPVRRPESLDVRG